LPPDAGIVQSVPCKSKASVSPSGVAATAMFVPSVMVTLWAIERGGASNSSEIVARMKTALECFSLIMICFF
jgi:hypothetical protein